VNLVANLIAAGIIYLVAAAAGYIKAKPAVTSTIVGLLLGLPVLYLGARISQRLARRGADKQLVEAVGFGGLVAFVVVMFVTGYITMDLLF